MSDVGLSQYRGVDLDAQEFTQGLYDERSLPGKIMRAHRWQRLPSCPTTLIVDTLKVLFDWTVADLSMICLLVCWHSVSFPLPPMWFQMDYFAFKQLRSHLRIARWLVQDISCDYLQLLFQTHGTRPGVFLYFVVLRLNYQGGFVDMLNKCKLNSELHVNRLICRVYRLLNSFVWGFTECSWCVNFQHIFSHIEFPGVSKAYVCILRKTK